MVFDESLQRCLDSYLHQAPRGLDLALVPSSPAVADVQRSVHRAVFMTFVRMATYKESKVRSTTNLNQESVSTGAVFKRAMMGLKWWFTSFRGYLNQTLPYWPPPLSGNVIKERWEHLGTFSWSEMSVLCAFLFLPRSTSSLLLLSRKLYTTTFYLTFPK